MNPNSEPRGPTRMDEQRISDFLDQLWQMFLAEDFAWSLIVMDLADEIAGRETLSGLFA